MQGRQNSFDTLRLVGAFLVVIGHSYVLTGQAAPRAMGIDIHSLGVKLFFIVSGFLITASYQRDSNLANFAVRRAARIMPALVVVLLLTVIALAFETVSDAGTYIRGALVYLARNVLLLPYHELPGVFLGNPYPRAVNGSLWTLPVEVFMYALTPCFVWIRPRILIVVAASILLAIHMSGTILGFGVQGAADTIPYFLLGAFAQLTKFDLPTPILLLSSFGLLIAIFIDTPQILVAAPLAIVVLHIGQSAWLSSPSADVSYGTYLLAFPVQQTLVSVFPSIDAVTMVAATLVIVIPLAILSWRFVERPVLWFARHRIQVSPMHSDVKQAT